MRRVVAFGVLMTCASASGPAQEYRVDTVVAGPATALPVAIAFPPGSGGKFFFTEKNTGRVRIFNDENTLEPLPFATLAVTGSGEQGLLGIAFHPTWPDSPFVYVYCTRSTAQGGTRDNMVIRFRDSSNVGIAPETLLVVPRTNAASNHNGGNIHFGPDGKLYVTVGDYAVSSNSQDTAAGNQRGKILRLNSDGSIPGDNPWPGRPFWSIGHRNSFDFTFDALTGLLYCTENGPSCNDEVNLVPRRGNMGWPLDGNCTYSGNPAYVRPLYWFPGNLPALTGIVVYRGTAFPRLRGSLLFTGNSNATLWSAELSPEGDTIVAGSVRSMFTYSTGFADVEIGPDGSIYLTNGPYSASRILRLAAVTPVFTSLPPLAATQDSLWTYVPSFSGTPPGLRLLQGPDGMAVDSASWRLLWTPTNAQALAGSHPVLLRAENGGGVADQAFTIAVMNVNDPPEPFHLEQPRDDTSFVFQGSPAIRFSWDAAPDPDEDTLTYTLELDTIATFTSPALLSVSAGTSTAGDAVLPPVSRTWFWRVRASDAGFTVPSLEIRRLDVTVVTAAGDETIERAESNLGQNFPNPFNPLTSITYTIPASGPVRLAVYNLLGQEVALIFEGVQSVGTHEVFFDKRNLPSGIYFYRIQAPGFVETKKMTVAK